MTKDEFLSMINSELENLEKEYQEASKKVQYFKTLGVNNQEYQEAEYLLKLVKEKCQRLSNLLSFPYYARVQAMSDVEIEQYKKDEHEKLELEIKKIEAEETKEREKLSQLKAEQDKLITLSSSSGLSSEEKEKGKQLYEQISRYDDVFKEFERKIENVRRKQEQIKTMTSKEIKKQIIKNPLDSLEYYDQTVDLLTKNPISSTTKLRASVASDPKKALHMADLETDYATLDDEQDKIKMRNKDIQDIFGYHYDTIEKVQELEKTLEEAKSFVNKQLTVGKIYELGRFYGRNDGKCDDEVDMDFLQRHADKLSDNELENLQILVEDRDKLLKKIIKTNRTKEEIEYLNKEIRKEQARIYEKIISWYKSKLKSYSGIFTCDKFSDLFSGRSSDTKKAIEACEGYISDMEKKIAKFKEKLRKIDEDVKQLEAKKDEIAQQIRALGGEEHKDAIVSGMNNTENNLNFGIIRSASDVFERKIVDRVQQEAQHQADIEEARLRGISVEELLQMRQQAKKDEPVDENPEEEVSHGMKM